MHLESPEFVQREFLAQIGPVETVRELFEYLPGVFFFAKDRESRMMCASRATCERLGCVNEMEVVGKTDNDFYPKELAAKFLIDDQRVINSGQALINKVEIGYNKQRVLDWIVTSKFPLNNSSGEIIGLVGVFRSYEGSRKLLLPYSQISKIVEYILENHRERISVADVSAKSNLSPRQLNRKFNDAFGMSVQDFLTKTRIQGSSDALLNTPSSISEIARQYGFCDQSAFTQSFRKHTGITPLKFRKQYAK